VEIENSRSVGGIPLSRLIPNLLNATQNGGGTAFRTVIKKALKTKSFLYDWAFKQAIERGF